jgi:hypothetical protein
LLTLRVVVDEPKDGSPQVNKEKCVSEVPDELQASTVSVVESNGSWRANIQGRFIPCTKTMSDFQKNLRLNLGLQIFLKKRMATVSLDVAHQLYGDTDLHFVVRHYCVEYMRYYLFQFAECFDSDYGDYLDKMEKGGVWGGEMEISALSQLYSRKFKVYDDRSFDLYRIYGDSVDDHVIHLFFVPTIFHTIGTFSQEFNKAYRKCDQKDKVSLLLESDDPLAGVVRRRISAPKS